MAQLNDTMVQGDLRVTGNIYGTATKATQDGDGNTISSTYMKASSGNKSITTNGGSVTIGTANGSNVNVVLPTIASGTNNGTIKVGTTDNIAVKGLGTAAYTASSNYMAAKPNISSTNMNLIAAMGNCGGMASLSGTDTTVNPNGQTGWHHFLNLSYETQSDNMWQTQIANAAGSTDLWVRSRKGGIIADGTAWVASWTRILTGSNWSNVVTKSALGLGNVNNTSDADKPVSTAQQTALDGKVDYGYVSDASIIDSNSTAESCKTYFKNHVSPGRCKIVYCKNGDEYTLIFSKQGSGNYGSIIKYGYAKNTIYMLRYKNTLWESTDWEVISAGSVNATTGSSILSTGSNGSMEILNGALSSASGGGGSCSIDGDGISFTQGVSGSSMTASSIATSGTGTFIEGASAKGRPIDGSVTFVTSSSLTWNANTTHLVVNRSAASTTTIDLKSLTNSLVYWLHVPRDNIIALKNSSAISTFYCYNAAVTTNKTTDTYNIRSHIKDSVHGGFSVAIVRSSNSFYVMMDY